MPDAPEVQVSSISGAGSGPPGEVLTGGGDREPRLSRRTRTLLAAVLVLAAGGTVGMRALAQDRAEQRERDAAFALADRVHLFGRLTGISDLQIGSRRLGAIVEITSADGQRDGNRVTEVRLDGPGLVPAPVARPLLTRLPVEVFPEASVDCGRVAAGEVPSEGAVVLTVVPRSELPHEQRLAAEPAQVREAALAACDLPDPSASPVVEMEARDGELLVFVDSVPRSKADLQLLGVDIAGFQVGGRPEALPPGTGGFFALPVRVTDCSRARSGELAVRVRLREGERLVEREAAPATQQLQPGAVPTEELLRRMVDAAC